MYVINPRQGGGMTHDQENKLDEAYGDSHTHENKSVLDSSTSAYTESDAEKVASAITNGSINQYVGKNFTMKNGASGVSSGDIGEPVARCESSLSSFDFALVGKQVANFGIRWTIPGQTEAVRVYRDPNLQALVTSFYGAPSLVINPNYLQWVRDNSWVYIGMYQSMAGRMRHNVNNRTFELGVSGKTHLIIGSDGVNFNTTHTMMKRADNGEFETAQVGVEYQSPDQQGGFFGTIHRQYFNSTLPDDLTSDGGISLLVGFRILFDYSPTNDLQGVATSYVTGSGSSSNKISILLDTSTHNLRFDDTYYVPLSGWVDYVKM